MRWEPRSELDRKRVLLGVVRTHMHMHTRPRTHPQVSGEDVAFSWLDFPTKVMCGVLGHLLAS